MLNTAQRKAFEILLPGAVQPTETFMHLVKRKSEEYPWQHSQRVSLMLRRLQRYLDNVRSEWKLVRVSRRGQAGLYQLQKREVAVSHAQQVHQKGNEIPR